MKKINGQTSAQATNVNDSVTFIAPTSQELTQKAIDLLSNYEKALIATECEGELSEHLLAICKFDDEVNPDYYQLLLQFFLGVFAKTDVHTALQAQTSGGYIDEFIELIGKLISFYRSMAGKQFDSMLVRWNIQESSQPINRIQHVIDETERKMKSVKSQIN